MRWGWRWSGKTQSHPLANIRRAGWGTRPHKPAEQQVVVELLHQQGLAPNGIQNLQQQGPQQPLRRNRRPDPARHTAARNRRSSPAERCRSSAAAGAGMVLRDAVFRVDIAEHVALLLVVSAHVTYVTQLPVERCYLGEYSGDFFSGLFSRLWFIGQATQHSAPNPGAACWAILSPSRRAGLGSAYCN